MTDKKRKYNDVKEAVEMLTRNSHTVVIFEKSIGLYNPGLKCLSASDYLTKYHKYKVNYIH